MIQQTIHKRICKCGCGEKFETTKINKRYIEGHQRKHNNMVQNEKRKRLAVVVSPMIKTYWIYNTLLGNKESVTISKEFLRGRNAIISISSHLDKIDDEKVPFIKDIAIIADGNNIILKRKKK